jgi:hypothetical protein
MQLLADRKRQLATTDPDGHLLLLSCGAALHHALVTIAAGGLLTEVDRIPEADEPDLLARIRVIGRGRPDAAAARMRDAIPRRRTDRRAFGDTTVPETSLTALRRAAEAAGAFVHVVNRGQMPMLSIATMRAATDELADPAYRAELAHWTSRPSDSGDGVPPAAAVEPAPRRVPLRDHVPGREAGLRVGEGLDRGASYLILFGPSDEPESWLRGGEALSAVLLTAVAEGLSAAPISDVIEQTWPRQLLRELLAGVGEPYLVVRVGVGGAPGELPEVPRRSAADVIDHDVA